MPLFFGENFREQQSVSRYPFTDTSNLTTDTGLTFDTAVITDCKLWPYGAGPRLALTQIIVTVNEVTFSFGDGITNPLAQCQVDPLKIGNFYVLLDPVGRSAGVLVADAVKLAAVAVWPQGTHTFAQGAADLVASCTVPVPEPGVLGITDGTSVIHGETWIIGEQGVVLTGDSASGEIQVNVVGDPLFKRRDCAGSGATAFVTPSYLRTINQVRPDDFGNFTLAVASPGDTPGCILRIEPDGLDGIKFSVIGPVPSGKDASIGWSLG